MQKHTAISLNLLSLTKLQQNVGEVCVFMYVTQHELQKGSNTKHTIAATSHSRKVEDN